MQMLHCRHTCVPTAQRPLGSADRDGRGDQQISTSCTISDGLKVTDHHQVISVTRGRREANSAFLRQPAGLLMREQLLAVLAEEAVKTMTG